MNEFKTNYKEEFKDIVGYEGLYQISNLGNVKSLPKLIKRTLSNNYISKEKIMIPQKSLKGYLTIQLSKNGFKKRFYIHRLVANAFIGKIEGLTIDHFNNNKSDNKVSNLSIMTQNENYKKYIKENRHYNINGKLILDVNQGVFYNSISEASKLLDVGRKTLSWRINNMKNYNLKLV